MKDLKQRTIRGGVARVSSQAASFLLRMGSLMILARLLDPKDFGLVGMVTAVIGVFSVFKDFGLSAAAVQQTAVTTEQSSALFWVNLATGTGLGLCVFAIAPIVKGFYHEPRLFGITAVLATAFLFNGCGIQHTAYLERQMRFATLSMIDFFSLLVSTAVALAMATIGFGYWSLVATATLTPLVYSICVWYASGWVPGRPHNLAGVGSMMRFGGTLTLNGLVMYIASNFDKVLLGRIWGVDALGIYGRAYQLISIPTDNVNSAAGGVMFAALSRLQGEPQRLKSYFLKGYSLVLSFTVPVALTCGLFADDLIYVFLGPKWKGAAIIFRLLAPTTLAFAILNPLGWLLSSLGLVGRGLRIAFVLGPILIGAYSLGLPYGPNGVALAYSTVMILSVIPLIAWATHGIVVSLGDVLLAVGRPVLSGTVAAGVTFGAHLVYAPLLPALPRLIIGAALVFCVYLWTLLYVMRQKPFYLDLLHTFVTRTAPEEETLVAPAIAN